MSMPFPDSSARGRDLDALISDLEKMNDRLSKELAEEEREAAAADDLRAQRARNGELGAEWEHVQQRIDQGRTTLSDVFSGRDPSPEATRLRQQSTENMESMRRSWERRRDQGETTPLDELHEAGEALARAYERVSQIIDQQLKGE